MSLAALRNRSALALVLGLSVLSRAADRHPSNSPVFRITGSDPHGTLVEFDPAGLSAAAAGGSFELSNFPLRANEATTIRLERFRVAAPDAQFVRNAEQSPLSFDPELVTTLRGEIVDHVNTHVYLAVSPYGIWGYAIDRERGERFGISSRFSDGTVLPIGQAAVFPAVGGGASLPPGIAMCGVVDTPASTDSGEGEAPTLRGAGLVSGVRHIQIAIDTDYDYYALFHDTGAAAAYVLAAYGAVSDIYIRDVNAKVTVVFVRIWDTPADLFSVGDPLGEFQAYWMANMGAVPRDVAQFFSGRRDLPAGGEAYLQGLCNASSYSWAGYVLGFFSDPSTPSLFNRDVMIPAHELGHNCATGHTQDYGLDTCHIETSQPRRGTIMSYCGQTFTGGEANDDLWFHTVNAGVMRSYIATRACIGFDCNRNGVEDSLDISSGTSPDANADGIPDDCQDCNGNGVLDPLDISSGTSLDRNRNARPDECEPDCNGNSIPDDLDLLHTVQSITFSDNFETNMGWTVSNQGISSGAWERGVPVNDPSYGSDPLSDGDGSGSCYVTQNTMGGGDVDGGSTTLTSPQLNMSGGGLSFGYLYFLRLSSSSGSDRLIVEVNSNNGVGTWTEVARHRHDGWLSWRSNVVDAATLAAAGVPQTAQMRVRFRVNDDDPDTTVEAGIDGFFVGVTTPPVSGDLDFDMRPDVCEGDCDGDGTLDYVEILADMSRDLNRNVVLDSCEDCDADGTTDLVALDHANNVWVADLVSTQIREYLGTYGTQTATSAATGSLAAPQDLIITPDRRVLVTSKTDSRVVEYSRSGAFVRTLVASGAGGLVEPGAMTIAPNGNLLVASSRNHSVLEFNINTGAFVRTFVPGGSGGLVTPFGLAFKPGGNLFVTSGLSQVLEFDRTTGAFVRVFVTAAANGGLTDPRGILWLPSGNLLVASHNTDQVLEYNGTNGAFVRQFSQVGDGTVLTLDQPWCLRLGPEGDVYCSRTHDHGAPLPPPDGTPLHLSNARIYRFDPASGYFVLCYVMGVNSNLVNPTGFDFVPDAGTDCNNNQFPDGCDIATGRSADVNENGKPDECETICAGDVNGDGGVNLADLAVLLSNFGVPGASAYSQGDLNDDDSVNLADLALLLARFGTTCP
jgi:hypothetical protein